jgi:hypothetical protein
MPSPEDSGTAKVEGKLMTSASPLGGSLVPGRFRANAIPKEESH